MAAATASSLVTPFEWEARLSVHLDRKGRGPKALFVVAAPALTAPTICKLTSVHILMATIALIEAKASIATVLRETRFMTTCACNLFVLTAQWKDRVCVSAQRNRSWNAEPTNRRVALHAVVTKASLMHRTMTIDARSTLTWSRGRPAIVARVARNFGVSCSQA